MPEPMNEMDLEIIVDRKIENALNDEDGDVSDLRGQSYSEYMGRLYGDEEVDRSRFVTREIFEAVEWAVPSILRVFTGTDRSVEFEATGEADEDQAQQETDIVNHFVNKDTFLEKYAWIKDILMYPNGYIKAWIEEKKTVSYETIKGLTGPQLAELDLTEGIEILEHTETTEMVPVGDIVMQMPFHDVKIKQTSDRRMFRIAACPPDEVLVDQESTSLDLDESDFVAHRKKMRLRDLTAMGFDEDEVLAAGYTNQEHDWNDEKVQRHFYDEESPDQNDDADPSNPGYWVYWCWIRVDYDGDGIAELRHVVLIGGKIFENEETDYQPLVACSAIPQSHKHIGMGYLEAVRDLQKVSTVLTRQMLDNIYDFVDKRVYYDKNATTEDTLDHILDARSKAVPVQGPPQQAIMPENLAPVITELLAALDHFNDKTQMRTGVAPELTLDPTVLKEATMGAFMGALENASQRLETLVRIIGEAGFKPLYKKCHQQLRKYIEGEIQIKIGGAWVTANPQAWAARDDVRCNVGLGHASKQVKMGLLERVLGQQKELMGSGMVTNKEVHNTLEKLVELGDIGSAASYFIDPESDQFQPPPPPEPSAQEQAVMMQAQSFIMNAQTKQQEMQLTHQREMQKMQADLAKTLRGLQDSVEQFRLERAERVQNMQLAQSNHRIESAGKVAEIRATNAKTGLTEAQEVKTYTDAGKTRSDSDRQDWETSLERETAEEVLSFLVNADEFSETSEATDGGEPEQEA